VAEHVWSVLCYRASVDKVTNNISLLHVIEQLHLPYSEDWLWERVRSSGSEGISSSMELVSYWVRSDFDEPESSTMRARLILPNGESRPTDPVSIGLNEHKSSRNRLQLAGISFGGFGVYWFAIEEEVGDEWVERSRVPLEVLQQEVADAPESEGDPEQ